MRRTTPEPRRRNRRSRQARTFAGIGLAAVLAIAACGGSPQGDAPATGRSSTTVSTFPTDRRVDLAKPTFSHPAKITNPLFPIELAQVIQVGHAAEGSLHQEVTLLPNTSSIRWDGRTVETVDSQFLAYADGRILEKAIDHFAQADDGSVWYFGEDVSTYEKGVVKDHGGTWLAGKDGPPGMIMPADPEVGDVYRPENIPGLVFEEVVVKSVGLTLPGPQGPVTGVILVEEHPMDGAIEDKHYAPGYGEFKAVVKSEGELVNVALVVPTDALPGGVPIALQTMSAGAVTVFDGAANAPKWDQLSATTRTMSTAWKGLRSGSVPMLLDGQIDDRMKALSTAVADRRPEATRQAAIDLGLASLDLQLRYRTLRSVEADRIGYWERQLVLDRAAHDAGGVAGDRAVLEAIRSRTAP